MVTARTDHSLKAGRDYGQYVRDAKDAGFDDSRNSSRKFMAEDSNRANRCHDFLVRLTK